MKKIIGLLILVVLFLVPFEVFAKEKLPTVQLRVLASTLQIKL